MIQRRDVKAFQRKTGAYKPIHWPWTIKDIRAHLDGRTTLGHYLVDESDKTRVVAFDIDFDEDFPSSVGDVNPREVFNEPDHPANLELTRYLRCMGDGLVWLLHRNYPTVKALCTFSGSKGLHVYGTFGGTTTAQAARDVALTTMASLGKMEHFTASKGTNFYKATEYPHLTIEVFPKQDSIATGGFGNLLRLPLGVNQKTGREGFFYDLGAPIDQLVPTDPIQTLEQGSIAMRSRSK